MKFSISYIFIVLIVLSCVENKQKILFSRGESKVYTGASLKAISFPVGGIGAGCIQMNGAGEQAIWQIFNNYTQAKVPHSFLAVRVEDGENIVIRALQTTNQGPFKGMKDLDFNGEYPFGTFKYVDSFPVEIDVEVFNPLIPMDVRNSSIPCAIFNVTIKNLSENELQISVLGVQQNAVGFNPKEEYKDANWLMSEAQSMILPVKGNNYRTYGGNINKIKHGSNSMIVEMTSDRKYSDSLYGNLAYQIFTTNASYNLKVDNLEELYSDFKDDGILSVGNATSGYSPKGKTYDAALCKKISIAPGDDRTITFALSWNFPHKISGYGQGNWGLRGNQYTNWWSTSTAVARHLDDSLSELDDLTHTYHDALYKTNLPIWMIDRIGSQVAILSSKTCFFSKIGYFGGWEGTFVSGGSCMGNCSHVWQYAQAHARLFPFIGERMRLQSFYFQDSLGGFPYRHTNTDVAFDGQCGEILSCYREHLNHSDTTTWLSNKWPKIKKAMDYTINRWDKDQDGLLNGLKHNTLDAQLSGCDGWLGSMYIVTLRAAEQMALYVNDNKSAKSYQQIHTAASVIQNTSLFNGEYYVQKPDSLGGENYLTACHSDQVLGQWWSHQLDLGWLYPQENIKSALQAVYKYNYKTSFNEITYDTVDLPRRFVRNDQSGLIMTTWPNGDRLDPENQIAKANSGKWKGLRFANEVWPGVEYSTAANMIYSGLNEEGFSIVKSVYNRYNGELSEHMSNRMWGYTGNPFGDDECGKFYSRSLSSWSLLLAAQGFSYNGPENRIGFAPNWQPEDHVSFFTTAKSWGNFYQKQEEMLQTNMIRVRYGTLNLKQLKLKIPPNKTVQLVTVWVAGDQISFHYTLNNQDMLIELGDKAYLWNEHELNVEIQFL